MHRMHSSDVAEKIRSFETRMVRDWNGKGEPWCVFDQETGDVLAEGLGIMVLRCGKPFTYSKPMTSLFEDITASKLGLEDLIDMTKSWLDEHATGGKYEHAFDEQTRRRLDLILEAWESGDKESGLSLCLCREADVLSQVKEDTLKGKIVTHFHSKGRPPSKQDEDIFHKWGLLELRIVSEDGVCVINKFKPVKATPGSQGVPRL